SPQCRSQRMTWNPLVGATLRGRPMTSGRLKNGGVTFYQKWTRHVLSKMDASRSIETGRVTSKMGDHAGSPLRPFRMKRPRPVHPFVRVRAEEVALGLDQVGWKPFPA